MLRILSHTYVESCLKAPIAAVLSGAADRVPDEQAAQAAIHAFLDQAKELLPRCRKTLMGTYDLPPHEVSYVSHLFDLLDALADQRYLEACEVLLEVIRRYHIEDRRLLQRLIALLEQ